MYVCMCLFKQDMRLTFFITTDTLLRKSYGELRVTRGIGHHHAGEGTVLADSCLLRASPGRAWDGKGGHRPGKQDQRAAALQVPLLCGWGLFADFSRVRDSLPLSEEQGDRSVRCVAFDSAKPGRPHRSFLCWVLALWEIPGGLQGVAGLAHVPQAQGWRASRWGPAVAASPTGRGCGAEVEGPRTLSPATPSRPARVPSTVSSGPSALRPVTPQAPGRAGGRVADPLRAQ